MVRLVVGLGNPGKEYEKTRHNVGWMVLDELCERLGCSFSREKFEGLFTEYRADNGRKVLLLKPLTFMNRSGESVGKFVRFYKLQPQEVLVVYDDLDLPLGKLRLRLRGSSGGHKGVLSVEHALGTKEFPRLRVGIGRPERKEEVVDYVLSPFKEEEIDIIEKAICKAVDCLEAILVSGEINNKIMNRCNGG
jgi:PTH1 family peptidyl-tRNA hydrolase